jgi:UDP-N-acetylglucosamine 2-epimerase
MMPLVRELRSRPRLRLTVAVTGQHREMLDQVFETFAERPDIDLQIMRRNQTLPGMTAEMLLRTSEVLAAEAPDLVLGHGDTTTAMATALAAFYARIRIGHVEAGLRSFDIQRPWPEEFNRVAVDAVADFLFAPTQGAKENLADATRRAAKVFVTGNTGIDALLYLAGRLECDPTLRDVLDQRYSFLDGARRFVLVTGHRRESLGAGLQSMCAGLKRIVDELDAVIVYPVHLNPQVHSVVTRELGEQERIHLIEPVGYADMVYLMKRANLIITDSGGIQEEAPALGKRVLVTRDVTERPEALATGRVRLVGTDPARIFSEAAAMLGIGEAEEPVFPYGDGTASLQIADIIESELVQ